ncbi:MAG: hypothetical protein IPN53_03665 [Comamonadaceae bacterium]|nr:hypothetical protein [Comamonadaceae bacterium]
MANLPRDQSIDREATSDDKSTTSSSRRLASTGLRTSSGMAVWQAEKL